MNRLKTSLTRKIGPFAAWVWALIAFVGIYYYRKRFSTQSSGTGTGSVQQSGPAPGTGEQVLQPGESIYDPTAGTLQTAPGGSSNGDTTGTAADLAAAMNALAGAIATGMPPEQVTIGSTIGDPVGLPPGQGTDPGKKVQVNSAIKSAGKSGLGAFSALTKGRRGAAKSKGQHNATQKTSKHTPKGSKTRTRSAATTRNTGGGRIKSASKLVGLGSAVTNRSRNATPGKSASRARQPARTPAAHTVVQQRRPATTPRPPATRQGGAPAPRPSAPPPRTQRAPARPAPPRRRGR